MRRRWIMPAAISILFLIMAGFIVALLVFMWNQPIQRRGVEPLRQVQPFEPDSAIWGENFPNQFSTYMQTAHNDQATEFGGSEDFSKLEKNPRLVLLFAGYGFSKGYNEERGHRNSLIEVRETVRLTERTPATCYSCKTSDNPRLWNEMGMADYDAMSFTEMSPNIDHPIGCANCHEANTMRLIVTNPALEEALQAQGRDWRNFTRQEMRTIVCANCHVEYYFAGEGNYLTFPWARGTRIEEMEQYYREVNFTDWTHPTSGAPMIKMQHPEYELYTAGSTHYEAGVACADCHMPYTRDGAVKFSTHNVRSPLFNPAASCGTCHTDVDRVIGRVSEIQNQVWATMETTEVALVEAIDTIAAAAEQNGNAELLEEARQLHRAAQLRWDFIAAENSMGFHNSQEALRILAAATDMARQAQIKAILSVQQQQANR
jgi:nitrite reductase (cytochrome c-552)